MNRSIGLVWFAELHFLAHEGGQIGAKDELTDMSMTYCHFKAKCFNIDNYSFQPQNAVMLIT